jgi:hypothetical protein
MACPPGVCWRAALLLGTKQALCAQATARPPRRQPSRLNASSRTARRRAPSLRLPAGSIVCSGVWFSSTFSTWRVEVGAQRQRALGGLCVALKKKEDHPGSYPQYTSLAFLGVAANPPPQRQPQPQDLSMRAHAHAHASLRRTSTAPARLALPPEAAPPAPDLKHERRRTTAKGCCVRPKGHSALEDADRRG